MGAGGRPVGEGGGGVALAYICERFLSWDTLLSMKGESPLMNRNSCIHPRGGGRGRGSNFTFALQGVGRGMGRG